MSLDNQFGGLRQCNDPQALLNQYNKQKSTLEEFQIWLKEIDGELEHDLAILSKSVEKKIAVLLETAENKAEPWNISGNYVLKELEENLICLGLLLDYIEHDFLDAAKARQGVCIKQSLRRVVCSLDQLLLFLKEPFKDLTSREQEILLNLSEGLSNEEIAEKLYISIKTVKNHVSSIYRKTGFRERAKLVLAARATLE